MLLGETEACGTLQLFLHGSILLVLTRRFSLGLFSLLLTILAGSHILRSSGTFVLALNGLAVDTLNVGVRRSHTSQVLVPALSRLLDFIALFINNACLGFVLGLELNLALKSFDLLRVKEVAILITVLNLLLLSNDSVLNLGLIRSRGGSRDDGLFLFLGDRGLILLRLNVLGC